MVWTEWLIMDKTSFLLFVIASISFYWLTSIAVMESQKEAEWLHKHAYLFGLAISVCSWFSVGLWSIGVIAFYNLGVFVVDIWMKGRKAKE